MIRAARIYNNCSPNNKSLFQFAINLPQFKVKNFVAMNYIRQITFKGSLYQNEIFTLFQLLHDHLATPYLTTISQENICISFFSKSLA